MEEYKQIYELHFKQIHKYALTLTQNQHLAEEITQETFYKALKNIHTYKGEAKLSTWLCQIAKNTYINYAKKENKTNKNTTIETYIEKEPQNTETSIENKIEKNEQTLQLHKIIKNLKEPYKEVFTLRTFAELSYEQIAQLFDKTPTWARTTHHRAKLKIKEQYDEQQM